MKCGASPWPAIVSESVDAIHVRVKCVDPEGRTHLLDDPEIIHRHVHDEVERCAQSPARNREILEAAGVKRKSCGRWEDMDVALARVHAYLTRYAKVTTTAVSAGRIERIQCDVHDVTYTLEDMCAYVRLAWDKPR